MTDQVIYLKDGFYAMVNGKLYGPWPMKEYAQAGLAVERRRTKKQRPAAITRQATGKNLTLT